MFWLIGWFSPVDSSTTEQVHWHPRTQGGTVCWCTSQCFMDKQVPAGDRGIFVLCQVSCICPLVLLQICHHYGCIQVCYEPWYWQGSSQTCPWCSCWYSVTYPIVCFFLLYNFLSYFRLILYIVFLCRSQSIVWNALMECFPRFGADTTDQTNYVRNLLSFSEYCPPASNHVLKLIISR